MSEASEVSDDSSDATPLPSNDVSSHDSSSTESSPEAEASAVSLGDSAPPSAAGGESFAADEVTGADAASGNPSAAAEQVVDGAASEAATKAEPGEGAATIAPTINPVIDEPPSVASVPAEVPNDETTSAEISSNETTPAESTQAEPTKLASIDDAAAPPSDDPTPTEPVASPAAVETPAPEPVLTEPVPTGTEPTGTEPTETEPTAAASGAPGDDSAAAAKPPSDTGKIVGGVISAISAEEVVLTLDDGRPGVINRRNFDDQNTDPTTVYNVGDRAEGAILSREDPQERVTLSRAWALKKRAWERVGALSESGELLSGTVASVSKKGVIVDVGVRGFVPATHLELEPPSDLRSYVGKTLEFKILEFDLGKERLVLSRRSQLLKEQRKQLHELLTGLEVGETRTGTVSSLTDYGAFVDVGGVNGLVHLSELSWSRVRHPRDVVSVGDEVQVKVLDVKVKKRRISLSIRQLAEDPLAKLTKGDIVTGPVSRLVDFGAFVELGGVEGLVHLSEMAEYRVVSPEEIVTPGEEVRAIVLSVDRKRRRIELSIRQAVSHDFG